MHTSNVHEGMRVMVIEDEDAIALRIRTYLEKSGYVIERAATGEEGLYALALNRETYGLILLDTTLSDMLGEEVYRRVRDLGIVTPILILTGEDFLKIPNLPLVGTEGYLVKPFSYDDLMIRIEVLKKKSPLVIPPVLFVGGITMNLESGRSFSAHKEIKLTPLEHALLTLFMRNPNVTLARGEIGKHLWGDAYGASSNVVDVHVKNLRKKIQMGNPQIRSPIETLRKAGYRLNG